MGLPYFEVAIQASDPVVNPDRDGVDPAASSVGLCGEFSNLAEAHPGWRSWSGALHGDDGDIFEENGDQTYSTGKLFGPRTTVLEHLFTLDGKIIGKAHPRKRNQAPIEANSFFRSPVPKQAHLPQVVSLHWSHTRS
jgi:hypothetical protein